jgi:hypothetical protein
MLKNGLTGTVIDTSKMSESELLGLSKGLSSSPSFLNDSGLQRARNLVTVSIKKSETSINKLSEIQSTQNQNFLALLLEVQNCLKQGVLLEKTRERIEKSVIALRLEGERFAAEALSLLRALDELIDPKLTAKVTDKGQHLIETESVDARTSRDEVRAIASRLVKSENGVRAAVYSSEAVAVDPAVKSESATKRPVRVRF